MPSQAAESRPVNFNRDIRPILSDACLKCHGPAKEKAKLRLDIREKAIAPGRDGVISIVPGKPDQSEVVRRIFSKDEDEVMPPLESHRVLSANQKNTIKEWIRQGAHYQKHWSFEPLVSSPLPKAQVSAINNSIDLFISDRLNQEKLTMSAEADRTTLIRRVAFTLTGLPPTTREVDAFIIDKSNDAYEKMVDQYLSSQRFGEELARHWLDVARYGDTHGMHLDNERQMWAYRDWVIHAFNRNLPYDQFVIQQVAGDLLPGATTRQIVATGFLRCNITTGEGGSISEEWIYRKAVERTSTVAQAFMGLTAGCAVCHDHKFDPISAKEYYSLYAFFHSAADPALDGNALLTAPTIKMPMVGHEEKIGKLDATIATKQKAIGTLIAKLAYADPAKARVKPEASVSDLVLFDDTIPPGSNIIASPGHPPKYVTAEKGQVRSGKVALRRTDKGLAQDVIDKVSNVQTPPGGRVYVHVYIDPNDAPKTLMIQYHTSGWLHRAVWGNYDAIPWGAAGTTQRVHIGEIPEAGKWIRLEVPTDKIGLKVGQKISGFAFTQFGGTVYWDLAGITGTTDPTADPRKSLQVWWKQQIGKNTPGLPNELKAIVKAGPNGKVPAESRRKLRDFYLMNVCADVPSHVTSMRGELAALRKQKKDIENSAPGTFIYRDLPKPRQSFVMLRGQYNKPGEKVEPNTPAVLPPLKKSDPSGRATRLDLARWMVSKEHPLTARVQANRLWQQVFGMGLVKTGADFGSQGEVPSHPELLDWLASYFQENGWDVKKQIKLMVMSATFRQASRVTTQSSSRDPDNRLYARGPRFRLDAEQIRDNALFVSGLMDSTMGGRGVKPYQPPNIWEPVGFVGSNTSKYKQDQGGALYRRSIYVFLKRTAPPPFMSNFDAPSREAFCSKRERSNSPLQALQLMNDVQQVEAARSLAQLMMVEGGEKTEERIEFAYRTVLARRPEAGEIAVVRKAYLKHLQKYKEQLGNAKMLINNGESKPDGKLNVSELAAWTMIANLMLNLDETLNRN